MMVGNERSPKRRRTDNTGPISADAIAQANSTLQVFTGQRQNRWMSGGAYSSPRQTPAIFGASASRGEKERNIPTATGGSREQSEFSTHLPVDVTTSARQAPSMAGAIVNTEARAQNANVVAYESPTTLSNPATATVSTQRKSMDNMAGSQPGLPSPATSEDNTFSPVVIAQQPYPQHGDLNQTVQKRRPGRPRSRPDHGHPSAAGTGSPLRQRSYIQQEFHQIQQQQRQLQMLHNRYASGSINMPSPASAMSHAHGQTSPVVPSQPFTQPPQAVPYAQVQGTVLDQLAMLSRYQQFRHLNRKYEFNGVDSGRLTLLHEAINKGDLFYIVLSQIHALTRSPDLIPQSARGLDPRCFAYLDNLLCPTAKISPPVLLWLAHFPNPILSIYFSPATAAIYEPQVQQVTHFLQLLPQHWDNIVAESKNREAPPLVEDLVDRLGLRSVVFQTAAFRAIARMVMDDPGIPNLEIGMEKLVILHQLDQECYFQGHRRDSTQSQIAYRAFRVSKAAWKQHEDRLRLHDLAYRNKPSAEAPPPPQFNFPPDVLACFPARVQYNVQSIPGNTTQRTPSQQQRAILENNYTLAQMQRSMTFGNSEQRPPPPPNLTQQQLAAMHQQVIVASAQPPKSDPRFVYPREGQQPRAQPTHPEPARSGLHQAQLRSPTLGPVQAQPDTMPLYRHVIAFALSPTKLEKHLPIQNIQVQMRPPEFKKITPTVPSAKCGEPPSRSLTEESQTYRLRCAAYPPNGFPSEASWVVADTYWPDDLYLEFNGEKLDPRRKLHHGRYLPIDITYHIREKDNTIKVIINRASNDDRPFEYVLAVEIIGVMSHETLLQKLKTIPASQSLDSMKTSLSARKDDDEVAITSSTLTIRLFDPYSKANIFSIPVRGASCPHKDCFDLDTFLSACKRNHPGWPTVVDCWRCPLCRGDVRPQTLVVDGFLLEVRKELEKQGKLDTRAILVEADGTWRVKEEEKGGVRSPSLEREERGDSSVSASRNKVLEIIEID